MSNTRKLESIACSETFTNSLQNFLRSHLKHWISQIPLVRVDRAPEGLEMPSGAICLRPKHPPIVTKSNVQELDMKRQHLKNDQRSPFSLVKEIEEEDHLYLNYLRMKRKSKEDADAN